MPGSGALVRFAFTNFGAFLLDTKDLSVIRGASALLDDTAVALPAHLAKAGLPRFETVFARASEALFHTDSLANAAALRDAIEARAAATGRSARPTFATAVRAWAPGETLADALRGLEASLRAEQLRRPTVIPGTATAQGACELDGVRPASATAYRGEGAISVSAATQERLQRGRELRVGLLGRVFPEAAGLDGRPFEADFDALAKFHEPAAGFPHAHGWTRCVPRPVRAKMCVVHGDGNAFGNCRARVTSIEGLRRFAAVVDDAMREALHTALQPLWDRAEGVGAIPLHILVWAGDEWSLVLPAGFGALAMRDLGVAFRDAVARALAQQGLDGADDVRAAVGGALTLTIGGVFCDAHEPIERAISLAKMLVEKGKARTRGFENDATRGNVVDFAVVESGFVPSSMAGLASRRTTPGSTGVTRGAMTLDDYTTLIREVSALKAAEFPSARVHAITRAAEGVAATGVSVADEAAKVTPRVASAARDAGVNLSDPTSWPARRELWDYVPY